MRRILRSDVVASVVVFLVALPLCTGVALASGVPIELGIVSGIVGGLVTGLLPGSSLQVTGPAAGLTVLVFDAVTRHGIEILGPVVLAAGLLQIAFGILKFGRWFQAISLSVVQGMLGGIGLLLILGQSYPLAAHRPAGDALANLLGIPGLIGRIVQRPQALTALGLGALTIAIMALWKRLPGPVRQVPAALGAVVLVAGLSLLLEAAVPRLTVGTITHAIRLPGTDDLSALLTTEVAGLAIGFALIASAESLFSAAAVDRMHGGPRTRFNTELIAQGTGNMVCGALGALPVTAVAVRSAVNVQAGARTRLSRVLHGLWLLVFVALAPAVLQLIPVTVLAGVLIYSGVKLADPAGLVTLWRRDRSEAAIALATTTAIVATDLLIGVGIGLALAILKTAWQVSSLSVHTSHQDGVVRLKLAGTATFLRLPRMIEALDKVPADQSVELDLRGLRHLDHACRTAVDHWVSRYRTGRGTVHMLPPATADSTT